MSKSRKCQQWHQPRTESGKAKLWTRDKITGIALLVAKYDLRFCAVSVEDMVNVEQKGKETQSGTNVWRFFFDSGLAGYDSRAKNHDWPFVNVIKTHKPWFSGKDNFPT